MPAGPAGCISRVRRGVAAGAGAGPRSPNSREETVGMAERILSDRDVWKLVAAGHLNLRGADLEGVILERADEAPRDRCPERPDRKSVV